ncbi:MAG: hemerythrin domain-containing protein [Candidatus Omnitrophica bacterium]|nr:hemerythrin domain-containing protein [Candidatus Omnitrophota bacterium]
MNIFEAIREDHKKQRTLLDILVKTHGDSEGREELFERLKEELQVHAIAEERFFYVPLMKDDLTQEKSRHSVSEHHEIDELIQKLEETDYSSPGWLPTAKKLQETVTHHLDEEEHEVFQMAGKVLTEEEKISLAKSYTDEMAERK